MSKGTSAKKKRSTHSKSNKILKKKSPADEVWGDFVEDVASAITRSVNSTGESRVTPFDEPDSVLKRMVYRFVRKHRKSGRLPYIKTAIAQDSDEWRGLKTDFDHNPFHWVLFGLQGKIVIETRFEITKWDVRRYGRHLNYADRHSIPPVFLIGFLLQSGNSNEICKKEADTLRYEKWYIARQMRKKASE